MEQVEIKVLNNVKDDAIKNYQLFRWVLVKETPGLKETTLVFERDDSMKHYNEIKKLETKFNNVYTIPSFLPYVFVVITLIYVSVIAILWLTHVLDVEKSILVVILAIPSGVLLLANVLITFLRQRQMNYHLNKKEEKYEKYKKLIEELDR